MVLNQTILLARIIGITFDSLFKNTSLSFYRMTDTVIVNPLHAEQNKEEPDAGSDISLCFLTYFCCCVPIIFGSI